jgi:hypothetical protein
MQFHRQIAQVRHHFGIRRDNAVLRSLPGEPPLLRRLVAKVPDNRFVRGSMSLIFPVLHLFFVFKLKTIYARIGKVVKEKTDQVCAIKTVIGVKPHHRGHRGQTVLLHISFDPRPTLASAQQRTQKPSLCEEEKNAEENKVCISTV